MLALAIFVTTLVLVIWQPRGLGIGWSAMGGAVLALLTGVIGWADRKPGAYGIMVDDIIGGVLAAVILWLLQVAWPGALA